jgi:basic membrane lipoprotein Med (substrate-binding protein (PBP1-ABC) superfamily)
MKRSRTFKRITVLGTVVAALVLVFSFVCIGCSEEGGTAQTEVKQSDVENFLKSADSETLMSLAGEYIPQETIAKVAEGPREVVLGCEWFSIIEGTTWTQRSQDALDWILEEFPNVTGIVQTEVMPDATNPVAERMIREKGADIILAHTEFMGLPLLEIADKYPDKYFVAQSNADVTRARNFIRYYGKQYQASYLAGLVAGALTETNHLGVIGAMYDSSVNGRINAFALGAQEVNPGVVVHQLYVGNWFDPPSEKEVAETLIDQFNCDVLTQQTDSAAGVKVAQDRGVWYIGKDADFVALGWDDWDTVVTSFVVNWQVVWERILKDYMMGDEYPENLYYLGFESSVMTDAGPLYTIDLQTEHRLGVDSINDKAKAIIGPDVLALIEKRRQDMINGYWDPFMKEVRASGLTGNYAPGEIVSPAGEVPSKEELLTMDYIIEGVIAPNN